MLTDSKDKDARVYGEWSSISTHTQATSSENPSLNSILLWRLKRNLMATYLGSAIPAPPFFLATHVKGVR